MEYQQKYEQLLTEKEKVELEFGLARRRFKELYVGCENELNNEKETCRQLEIQVKELARQNEQLTSENEGIRIAAKISEESIQEEYETLNIKHQEEIASLQHIWKEASNDRQNSLVKEFEEEHKKLLEANSKLEHRIRQMSDEIGLPPKANNDGLVSMMTNAFTSKKTPNVKGPGIDGPSSLTLENTQQQAQHDIDAWKSVVHPLEREVQQLKIQLAEAHKQINSNQHAKDSGLNSKKFSDKELLLNEELKEAQKYFESEKSARTDLEMYVAVLNTQKSVLQEDSDKLKRELHNVCRLFEQEKMNHNELKQTWKLANEQFLQQQQNMFYEFERMKNLLTPQQFEQLSNNTSHTSNPIRTVAEHPYQVTTSSPDARANKVHSSDNLIDFDTAEISEPAIAPITNKNTPKGTTNNHESSGKMTDAIFSTFFPAAYHAKQFNEMLMDDPNVKEGPLILSSSSDSEDDDLVQAIHIQNMNRYGVEEGIEVQEVGKYVTNAMINPVCILEDFENENILTKSTSTDNILNQALTEPTTLLHEKSLSQGDVSTTSAVELKSEGESDIQLSSPNDSIWNNIPHEYAHTCMMCQNYEKQLQRLQKDYMSIKERERQLLDNVTSLELQLDSSKENYCILEKSVENIASESRSQLCIYEKNQQEVEKQVTLLHCQFQEFKNGCLQEIKVLSGER